jgi:hypothetical protein
MLTSYISFGMVHIFKKNRFWSLFPTPSCRTAAEHSVEHSFRCQILSLRFDSNFKALQVPLYKCVPVDEITVFFVLRHAICNILH